jgi:hypothetical protein
MHKQSSEYVFSSSKLKFQELLSFLQFLEPLKSSMLICLKESDLPSQVFLVAESKGFKFDLELKEMIQNMFSAVGQTTIDENGFKVQRMAESSSSNRAMSNQRRWSSLITSGVATDPFRFRELPDFRDEVIPPGFSQRDMGSMYNSTMKNCSPEIRGVTGENRTPSWYSPAPRNESAVDADLDLWRQMDANNTWDAQGLQWLGCLLSGKSMLVRNVAVHGDRWLWPLADSGLSGKFSWPAQERVVDGVTYYTLAAKASIEESPFLHVLDYNQWEAVEVSWVSPLGLKVKHPDMNVRDFGPMAAARGKAQQLIKFAASKAFFNLTKAALQQLGKKMGCEILQGDTLLVRLRRMVLFELGPP